MGRDALPRVQADRQVGPTDIGNGFRESLQAVTMQMKQKGTKTTKRHELAILAAGYLGPEGYGNDRTGLRPWPSPLADALQQGKFDSLHWSMVSGSDPSRFARMDLMCRLGLMAVEILDAGFDTMTEARRERLGVCVETFTGSLDTDIRFLQTPRPSLFAYTLPSTVIGEICIRYRLKGPVLCLVSPEDSGNKALAEAAEWLAEGDAEACLCVNCEVLDADAASTAALPDDLRPRGWHACALLVGKPSGVPRERLFSPEPLVETCRKLCSEPM
jgi:3-oxoacyl-(acyl-carrier-protein) synthase